MSEILFQQILYLKQVQSGTGLTLHNNMIKNLVNQLLKEEPPTNTSKVNKIIWNAFDIVNIKLNYDAVYGKKVF